MTATAMTLQTRRGTNLALDARHRDALAEYAKQSAEEAGVPVQTWVRQTWGFKDYEAKHLIRGDASWVMWERILKLRGPHCGWRVAIPILGAVIGEDLADHFAAERREVAIERARYEAEETRISALEAQLRERRSFAGHREWAGAVRARRAADEPRLEAPRVGHRAPPD